MGPVSSGSEHAGPGGLTPRVRALQHARRFLRFKAAYVDMRCLFVVFWYCSFDVWGALTLFFIVAAKNCVNNLHMLIDCMIY